MNADKKTEMTKKTAKGGKKAKKPQKSRYNALKVAEVIEYCTVNTIAEASRYYKIAESTIRKWIQGSTTASAAAKREAEVSKQQAIIRRDAKAAYVRQAWQNLSMSNELISRRLTRALQKEAEIDELMTVLRQIVKENANPAVRQELSKHVISIARRVNIADLRDLTEVVRTMYNTQALASDDKTANVGVSLSDILARVEGDDF